MIRIYCDGGARGNPGPAAAAFVVEAKGKVIHKEAFFLGKATNNVAEYSAVVSALDWAANNFPMEAIGVALDSELVAKQMSGIFKIKNEALRNYFFSAKELEKKISGKVFYTAVGRNKNKLADFLVNKVLDENS